MRVNGPVAVDARRMCGERSGLGVFTAALVERWIAAGHPVRLLVDSGCDLSRLPAEVRRHVTVVPAPFHLRAAALCRRQRLRYYSPDSLIVPALLGKRATATVHDLAPILHPQVQTLRVRLAYGLLLRLGTRRARCVVVPSRATARDLRRLSRHADVVVVPEGPRAMPAPSASLPAGVSAPYVLFAGTLEPRKHPVELVEAFLTVAQQDWQLVLAGGRGWLDDRATERLQRLAADHADRVHLLGYVEDTMLATLLARASVLAYPSSYEGFGLPVVEAMAAGVPVVTTNAAALTEVAGDAALIVNLDSADALTGGLQDALLRIMTDDALRTALADRGRQRAAAFSWDTAAERVWQVVAD